MVLLFYWSLIIYKALSFHFGTFAYNNSVNIIGIRPLRPLLNIFSIEKYVLLPTDYCIRFYYRVVVNPAAGVNPPNLTCRTILYNYRLWTLTHFSTSLFTYTFLSPFLSHIEMCNNKIASYILILNFYS